MSQPASTPVGVWTSLQSQQRLSRFLPYVLCASWALLLALLWKYEEPSKFNTVLVAGSVVALAWLMIAVAKSAKVIASPGAWLLVLALKLTLSFLITSYLWTAPLQRSGLLRVSDPEVAFQDSNLYDYQAAEAAQHGLAFQYLTLSWQSFGIVGYLAVIYRVFGVSVWYISMFNALLSLLGFLALTATMTLLDSAHSRQWQLLRFGMLIPYVAYYDATPAKEPLTFACFYLTLFFLLRFALRRDHWLRTALLALVGLTLLTIVRPNVALLLAIPNLLWLLRRAGLAKGAIIIGLASMAVLAAMAYTGNLIHLAGYFSVQTWLSVSQAFLSARAAIGDNSLKLAVGNLLVPNSLTSLVLWAPVRVVIWTFLPYPVIMPDWGLVLRMPDLLINDPVGYFRLGADLPALASAWLLMIAAPFVAAAAFARKSARDFGFKVLLLNLLTPLVVISNLNFIQGRRYRTLLEPLILAVALWGWVHGRPRKYQILFYILFGAGLLFYLLYAAR